MPGYTQDTRAMKVATPLGKDKLLLTGFVATEAISELYELKLDCIAENATDVAFDKLLGQSVTVEVELQNNKKRFFAGIVNRISQGHQDKDFTSYRLEVVPQLWLLTKRTNSRIFQQMNVPDILKKVLAGLDVEWQIQGTFEPRDYVVQYHETDFNFASRMMEEEGIYYYFKHGNGSCKMCVANTPQSHADMPAESKLIFDQMGGGDTEEGRILAWQKSQEIRSGKVVLWDHCFELPGQNLEANKPIVDSVSAGKVAHKLKAGGGDQLEVYAYPGEYAQRFDGIDPGGGERASDVQKIFKDNARTAEIRMQAEAAGAMLLDGSSTCRQLCAGHKFTLKEHFNADGSYVLASVVHSAQLSGDFRSGQSTTFHYHNTFTCMPAALPYRPERKHAKPTMKGTQTAVVVGPAGEEIFVDKYSRVKVQFPWDREGKKDAGSSCWVRVGSVWAGKSWGVIQIPRIGQEVIVSFLEGDPDQPIIVGSVYNAEQMPPYKLPDKKNISGFKSNSTLGGGGYNEYIFDDTKGKELIQEHGQYDKDSKIEHDLREHVLNDRTRDVTNNESITIGANRTKKVGKNETIEIGENQTIKVGKNRNETIVENETLAIGGQLALSVAKDVTIKFDASATTKVGKEDKLEVGGGRTTSVTKDDKTKVGGSAKLDAAKKISLKAGQSIELKCGGSSIKLTPSKITIKSTQVEVSGATVKVKGGMTEVSGGMTTIKGGLVKIN